MNARPNNQSFVSQRFREMVCFCWMGALVLIPGMESSAQRGNLDELDSYLKKTVHWEVNSLEKKLPLKVYYAGTDTGSDGAEVIVYLKNQGWERIGQESDLSILRDFIAKKFIVITVDFGKEPRATSPDIDAELHDIFKAVYGYKTESLLTDLGLVPKEYRCFFVPEGYRVATHLVYWEIDKHAVYGTMEYIMKSYNEDIVPKVPGLKTVSSPDQMVDRHGKPFDFGVKMDIVYPSQAKKKLPVMFLSETQASRNPNGQPKGYVPHLAGFTTRGYVYAVIGHCFNPCVNHFFHFSKFTLDHENGYACYTAAMRYLYAHAGQYNMDTRYIGGIGYSKGQYAITRLSDPDHEGGSEIRKFKGYPDGTPEQQPWQGYPSKISAGMQGMGMGLFEPEYITADYAPTLIVCGEKERDVISKEGHPKFVRALEAHDANHLELFMQDLAHELPHGYDERMGVDRYQLVHDFFDRYLKPEAKLPPVVLLVSPHDQQPDVRTDEKVSIHFAPVIDAKTIVDKDGVRIRALKTQNEVKGKWTVSHGGTKFTFTPGEPLDPNDEYEIKITTRVKDLSGTRLEKQKVTRFKVAAFTYNNN